MKTQLIWPVLAGGTVAVMSVVGGLLPYTGVMEALKGVLRPLQRLVGVAV